jgi:hypothetical protein
MVKLSLSNQCVLQPYADIFVSFSKTLYIINSEFICQSKNKYPVRAPAMDCHKKITLAKQGCQR